MGAMLETLRKRSEEEKQAIAAFSAVGVIAVLFIAWGAMGLGSFASTDSVMASENNSSAQPQVYFFASVSAAFANMSGAFESSVENLRGIQKGNAANYSRDPSETGTVVPVSN